MNRARGTVAVCLTLLGCSDGGASGQGGSAGSGMLELVATTPADGAVDVEPDTSVVAEFDATLDAETVTDASFTLVGPDDTGVENVLDVDGTTASRLPTNALALLGTYNGTVTTGIESAEGATLSADASWSFTVRDGVWGAPVFVQSEPGDGVRSPRIALDAAGAGVAVWAQSQGTLESVWANRFVGGEWGTPEPVDEDDLNDASFAEVALAATGDGVAVWVSLDPSGFDLWASRFADGVWATPVPIETDDTGGVFVPALALAPSGDGVVVWPQSDGARINIWASRFVSGIWETRRLVETEDAGDADQVDVALDPAGNGVAVWRQLQGSRPDVWASSFVDGIWGAAGPIETNEDENAIAPRVALDGVGDGVAVWLQLAGASTDVWTNRYEGGAWGTAERLETLDGSANTARVALDSAGNGFAIWTQRDEDAFDIWVRRFEDGAWRSAEMIDTIEDASAFDPELAVDALGNAIAVWRQAAAGQTSVVASRYADGAWGEPQAVSDPTLPAIDPRVAVDPSGRVSVVWTDFDTPGGASIGSNRFE